MSKIRNFNLFLHSFKYQLNLKDCTHKQKKFKYLTLRFAYHYIDSALNLR